jgi:uncharacterized lipoprotein YbaY
MSRSYTWLASVAIGLLAGAAVLGVPPVEETKPAVVRGLLEWKDRLEFLPDTMIEVTIRDESAKPTDKPLGKQIIRTPRRTPVPFAVEYNPADLKKGSKYVIRARVFVERAVHYASSPDTPVLNEGQPATGVTVLMKPVSPGAGK